MSRPRGFIDSLFDFSFTTFVTSKIIKYLYGVWIATSAVSCVSWTIYLATQLHRDVPMGLIAIFMIAYFAMIVILGRVAMEVLIVLFRIAENTAELAERGRAHASQVTQPLE